MTARLHTSFAEFWAAAGPLFRADPVRHTVPLLRCSHDVGVASPDPGYSALVTVDDGGRVGTAALATADVGRLLVSALPEASAAVVARLLAEAGAPLTGVTGPITEAETFAECWARCAGCSAALVMRSRLYELGELDPPIGVPGRARLIEPGDADWLASWWVAFRKETGDGGPGPADSEPAAQLRRLLRRKASFVLWEVDGAAVSWAGFQGPVEHSARIAPVYTPVAQRGRGYGSAVTAAATELAQTRGARHVLLYTDLANPVSNSIYQKIGYRAVHDAVNLRFA